MSDIQDKNSKLSNSKYHISNFIQEKLYYLFINILIITTGYYRYKLFGFSSNYTDLPIVDMCYILWFWYIMSRLIILKKDTYNTNCNKVFVSLFVVMCILYNYNLLCNW